MKKIIYSSLVILMMLSCKNEDNLPGNVLPSLTIDKVKQFIPNIYQESSTAVYINSVGLEKIFEIHTSEGTADRRIEDKKYVIETFTVNLNNDDSPSLNLYITAGANYTDFENYIEYITCGIPPMGIPGYRPGLNIGSDGEPILSLLESERNLLGKIFVNVYTNYKNGSATSFSELFYTIENGVVGFRDVSNNLWVLERYE